MRQSAFFLLFIAALAVAAEEPLSDRLLSPIAEVREGAVREFDQLSHQTQERFVPTLMVGLSSEDPDIHEQSAALLKKLGATPRNSAPPPAPPPPETPVVRKTRDQERLEEIQRLKTDHYKDLKAELEKEKNAQQGDPLKTQRPESGKTDPIRDALIDGLTDSVPFVRSRSARRLAGLQPPAIDAIPLLIKMLHDTDAECRGSAAGALGSIGPAAREAEPELERLTTDENPSVRGVAKAALLQVRGGSF